MSGLVGWLAIVLAALACEVSGRLLPGRMPTFADVVAVCTATRARRLVVVGAWIVLGWHLFVQPPRV